MSKPLHLLLILAGCCGYAAAAPYGPDGRETRWQQPGGAVLDLRVYGDEFYGRTETPDGYTVFLDQGDLTYYYASLTADGNSQKSSGIRADLPAPAGFAKHLEISKAKIREINLANRAKWDAGRTAKWNKKVQAVKTVRSAAAAGLGKSVKAVSREIAAARVLAAPLNGKKTGLTILIQFPGDSKSAPINFPTSQAKIERFCNEVGYTDNGNTGSVRDYYYDQSLGQLTYTQSVTKIITVSHPRDYYNFSDYPTNRVISSAGNSGRRLLTDAVNLLLDQGFDFSDLSLDEGNQAIATNVFFAGPDSGVWAQGLWPHQSGLGNRINVGSPTSPLYINNYQITNIQNGAPVIGTFCHENGHLILGYPDLYSVVGEGVGEHCLMGSGNYLDGGRTPSPIDAYLKDIAGWENVTELQVRDFVTKSLPTTGNVAYKILKPGSTDEFYMVENRGAGDRWARYSDDKGIAIWHIDQSVAGGNIDGTPHYAVALEQADGRMDLENPDPNFGNRGDAQDLFDLATPRFADNTTPDANWWSGKNSGVRVQVMSVAGKQMKVQFGAIPPDTIIIAGPNGGEVIFPQSVFPITWEANVIGNVKLDLYKGGVFDQTIAANEENDGFFKWAVPKTLVAGSDYTIVISSLTNPVPATDTSDAPFSINTNSFPEKGAMPYGWFKPGSASRGFEVTTSTVFEGKTALVSQQIGDGKTAAIAYRSNFNEGVVSFYLRVSSEQSYDVARFYIDGVPQILGLKDKLSGRVDWSFFSFPLPAGKHTLEWAYEKDTSYLGGGDAAWLDGVVMPDTTQEIAIENQAGDNLVSGDASHVFPDVAAGSASKSRVFTIKNLGKADLTHLKIGRAGADAGDFILGKLKSSVLKPGESTTFKVIFAPRKAGLKSAGIRVYSNDRDEAKFAIAISGLGLDLAKIAAVSSRSPLSGSVFGSLTGNSSASATRSVEVIGGRKYLALTVTKPTDGGSAGRVEVSANLLDWFSGSKHTTVLIDDANTLKVRDNTPVTKEAKRYIRLR